MRRLLFISNLFPDSTLPWRGLDNVTLLHAMWAQRPEVEIRVICVRPGHGFWKGAPCQLSPRPGDEVFSPHYAWAPYIPKAGGWNDRLFEWGVRRALKSLPKGWKPDAVLVPWLFPDASGVARSGALAGVPLVAVAQGSDVHQYMDLPMRKRAILNLAKRARKIITRSEDLRQRLISGGAAADKVLTVYNGVDLTTFCPGDPAPVRAELGLPSEGKIALFVGNFLPVKGLDLLVRAVARVRAQSAEPVHLVLIGSGPLESTLKDLIQESGLGAENVTFAGRRSPSEVARFMRAASVVCLSSINEGVPNVVLETLASGRPLLSTHVGGIHEIMDPLPQGGQLVSGRDPETYATALQSIFTSDPRAGDLAAYAQAFSWDKCASTYWASLGA